MKQKGYKLEGYLGKYDAVAIVPVKSQEPVLILKYFGQNFNQSDYEGGESLFPLFDCAIYWKDKKTKSGIFKKIKKQYGEDFYNRIMGEIDKPYFIEELPQGVLEIPLGLFNNQEKVNFLRKEYISPVSNLLRKLGVKKKKRGSIKTKSDLQKFRDRCIVDEFKRLKQKKPFPIKAIKQALHKRILKVCPEHFNMLKDSDPTIRRVLKASIKK